MNLNRGTTLWIFALLALLMLSTRFAHFFTLPDASWAVFFAAGFYCAGHSRWAFPLLMLEAVAIDFIVTRHLGISDYCITPAYAFLVPAHAALWYGGVWLRRGYHHEPADLLRLVISAGLAVNFAYLLSNSSFYWLGGRISAPNWAQYLDNYARYYANFQIVPAGYLALIALLHGVAAHYLPALRLPWVQKR
ncbi:hypothetical protein SAMN04488038_101176 [Solimonas aquatica]|uniref:Uncharacterized protein n=1 Tax=Solimonas aquatica TaxID=489703 RepID=A0A1H8ZVF8_9GAMM|nr:hypothetical protein [Solimonas aquatica]SEP68432.1 hypothetical protein SAMN04488038_101176 [Solimonas aquatica]